MFSFAADSRAIGFEPAPDRRAVQNPSSLDEMFGADGWVDASVIVNTIPKGGTAAAIRAQAAAGDGRRMRMKRSLQNSGKFARRWGCR